MSTSRNPEEIRCTADLGAQYISATPEYRQLHSCVYEGLLMAGSLKPLTCNMEGARDYPKGTEHFVAPNGISSIIKHFIDQTSGMVVEKEKQLESLVIKDKKWEASSKEGKTEIFDCVIVTIPVPQILQLKGDIHQLISNQPSLLDNLRNVEYSARFALALFYNKNTKFDLPWDVKYFYDDPCIRYVSVDNKKRGCGDIPSIVVHTSVPFGFQHLEEDKNSVSDLIMTYLKQLMPGLPEPDVVKSHKWRYSQVHKPYVGTPGCVTVHKEPRLVIAGDAFTHSNFDGCIKSAETVTKSLLHNL